MKWSDPWFFQFSPNVLYFVPYVTFLAFLSIFCATFQVLWHFWSIFGCIFVLFVAHLYILYEKIRINLAFGFKKWENQCAIIYYLCHICAIFDKCGIFGAFLCHIRNKCAINLCKNSYKKWFFDKIII